MIIDAHMHITQKDVEAGLLKQMEKDNFFGVVCGTDPQDAERVAALVKDSSRLTPTYGLHPWFADQFDVAQMEPYFRQCAVIGEIGLDSIWCQVEMDRQRSVFLQQMEIAKNLGKAVLLHTKGMEEEIAFLIRDFPMPVILHWYSAEDHLDSYLKRDCYFTVGPDVCRNKAVQQVVEKVPVERLLVESDGLDAVEWAVSRPCPPEELRGALENTIRYIAQAKQMEGEAVRQLVAKTTRTVFSAF